MTTRITLSNRKSVTFAVGGIFGLVGVILLAIAAWTALSSHRLRRDGLRADGEVIELVRKRDSDGGTTWAPVFRFTTAEGKVIEVQSSLSSSPASHAVGEPVQVLYRADTPHAARIDSFFPMWGISLILGGMGVVFGGVALALAVAALRTRQRRRHLDRIAQTVQASLTAVDRISDDAGTRFRIRAQWLSPRDNTVHVFESEDLDFDPTAYIPANRPITVRIDPDDPGNHAMDIGFLPKRGS